MAAKTRYFDIDSTSNSRSFTVATSRSERVEASQVTTSATAGVQIRISVTRASVSYQLVHDMFIPAQKVVEPLFRGVTFEAGDVVVIAFAPGSADTKTWVTLTTDEQTV